MKKYLLLFACFFIINVSAQERLKLSPNQMETLFLRENLQLIAEKMNIDIADAAVTQAKLWENPELSIGQVNVWTPEKEKQFSVELSQLIYTAGKHRKLVAREKTAKEMAVRDFEDVLRGLKLELRKSIYELAYCQEFKEALNRQSESLAQLISAYQKQVTQGNIAKTELLRLQSSALALESEINELQTEYNAQQKFLKLLLNINYSTVIEIDNSKEMPQTSVFSLDKLVETAVFNRPDAKRLETQVKFFEKSLSYEKSLRAPDITLSANYDRFGGVWDNFVGVGVSFSLPVFNQNNGNIRAAKVGGEQSRILLKQQQSTIQQEVVEAFDNYTQAVRFYNKVNDNELLSELDNMLDIYTKNLLKKNISMLEFIDFMDTYKSTKQLVITAQKQVGIQFEELECAVGTILK